MTSHAAVVARGMGRPCIVGAGKLFIDQEKKTVSNKKIVLKSGDLITIDGFSGEIYLGKLETADPELSNDYLTIMNWADKYRNLQIRSNAETVTDISKALSFGAEGVGLCRTEHMFFEDERIIFIREMIMSDTKQGREIALKKLLNFQRDDFIEIFRLLKEKPITIRLLDLPMHEFLPNSHIEIKEVANALNVGESYAKEKVHQLQESNPMLGHRGVRMAITYPEIYEMQVRAIFEAVVYVKRNNKLKISPEIMIPLVSNSMEIKLVKRLVQRIRNRIEIELGEKINFTLGTMIELPSAAVRGKEISKEVSFFSFGTNDLTQTVLGLSRDDSSKFLNQYVEKKLFEKDPFVSIDIESVGKIVEIGTINGRQGNNSLKIGICGEHGADPESINFFEILGIDYISCSPYKIPLARLAAAQASILLDRK
jgi:pyruvate,orthophosphate dikinase